MTAGESVVAVTTGQPHRHEVVACLGSPPPDVVAVLGPDSAGTATGAGDAAVDTEKLRPESFRAEELLNRVRAVLDG